jgi:hypothetical protein
MSVDFINLNEMFLEAMSVDEAFVDQMTLTLYGQGPLVVM